MDKKFNHKDLETAKQLANSPTGQQLLSYMQQTDPNAFDAAMKQLSAGDFSNLSKTLAPLLASEEVQKILSQFGGK